MARHSIRSREINRWLTIMLALVIECGLVFTALYLIHLLYPHLTFGVFS